MSTFGLFPTTTNVKTSSIDFNSTTVPKPPPVGYFNEDIKVGPVKLQKQSTTKSEHINRIKNACQKTAWTCAYSHIAGNPIYTTGSTGSSGDTVNPLYYTGTTGYYPVMTVNPINITGTSGQATNKSNISNALQKNFSNDEKILDDYTSASIDIPCNIVNILINLGYTREDGWEFKWTEGVKLKDNTITGTDIYESIGSFNPDSTKKINSTNYDRYKKTVSGVDKYIYLKKVANNEQALYNACQLAVNQSKQFSVKELVGYSIHYTITDIFKAFPNQSLILIVMLIISIYLLSAGTMASADIGYAISYIITTRSNSSSPYYWIGLFLGLLIPAGLLVYHITNLITNSYKRLAGDVVREVTTDPYGETLTEEEKKDLTKGRITDIGLITLLIFLIYVVVGFIFWVISSKSSTETKMLSVFVLLIILSAMIYVLYYIAPVLSSTTGDLKFIRDDLKVYTNADGTTASVMTNAFVESNIRYSLFLYSIAAIVITAFYLRSTKISISSMNMLESVKEGFMSSFAILALPIIWVVNWMIGVNFFIIYPFVIMIARYFRYMMYYSFRQKYLADATLRETRPHLKEEFDSPETYQAPWDLLGVTIMKYMMKMNGTPAEYSQMVVDSRNGMKNAAGNSYVTGHFLRLMMRSKESNTEFGYAYQGTITFITLVAVLIVLYGVVGSKNIPYLQLSSNVNIYNLPESGAGELSDAAV